VELRISWTSRLCSHGEEEADYEEIIAGSPKLKKMGREYFRAIDEERRKREGGNGNG